MNVPITSDDLRAYQSLGFDTSLFNEEDEFFSIDTYTPIPMVQFCDSHKWGKYCRHFMELDFYEEGQVKKIFH